MAANYLEQLLAEWYEYNGYFLRRNVLVGKRKSGGYDCELDIVAFHPGKNHLVHIESSMDGDSWEKREKRFRNKFESGSRCIPNLFAGFKLPAIIECLAVFAFVSTKNRQTVGGGKIVQIDEILAEIFTDLKTKSLSRNAIPEHLAILRSFQFVVQYKNAVFQSLGV